MSYRLWQRVNNVGLRRAGASRADHTGCRTRSSPCQRAMAAVDQLGNLRAGDLPRHFGPGGGPIASCRRSSTRSGVP